MGCNSSAAVQKQNQNYGSLQFLLKDAKNYTDAKLESVCKQLAHDQAVHFISTENGHALDYHECDKFVQNHYDFCKQTDPDYRTEGSSVQAVAEKIRVW